MQTMVDTIFNCINLAARIGIVVYLIRKYMVRFVANSISYELESAKLLDNKCKNIKEHSKKVEKKIQDQEKLYLDLQKKFATWKQSIDQQELDFQSDCLRREKIAKMLFEQKQKNIERKIILQHELPVLLGQLQDDIQAQVKQDQELNKKYIQNIMLNISEE